jgi:hypothetical protein
MGGDSCASVRNLKPSPEETAVHQRPLHPEPARLRAAPRILARQSDRRCRRSRGKFRVGGNSGLLLLHRPRLAACGGSP